MTHGSGSGWPAAAADASGATTTASVAEAEGGCCEGGWQTAVVEKT